MVTSARHRLYGILGYACGAAACHRGVGVKGLADWLWVWRTRRLPRPCLPLGTVPLGKPHNRPAKTMPNGEVRWRTDSGATAQRPRARALHEGQGPPAARCSAASCSTSWAGSTSPPRPSASATTKTSPPPRSTRRSSATGPRWRRRASTWSSGPMGSRRPGHSMPSGRSQT